MSLLGVLIMLNYMKLHRLLYCCIFVLLPVSCSCSGIVDGAAVKLVQPGKTLSLSPDASVEGRFAEVLNCFAVQVVSDSIIVFQVPASVRIISWPIL